jgi:uncharacterized protein YbaP (TraB family)
MRAHHALAFAATLSVLFGACALAREAAPPPAAKATAPRPLLWKVSDADNSVYLLGSFHALKDSDYPLAASVDAAFADAEAIAFEVSPEEMNSPELGRQMMGAATFTDGGTLERSIDAATWQRLQAYLKKKGVDAAGLQRLEPWFVAIFVTMSEMEGMGYDSRQGLDRHLMAQAAKAGKPTLGLETALSQIRVLDGMTPEEQRESLAEALDDAAGFRERMEELHGLWRKGDEARLEALLAGDFRKKYPALYRRVNVERNQAWMPKVGAMLDGVRDKDTLVVVGTMHLLGADGLVSQLRAKGYRVERL